MNPYEKFNKDIWYVLQEIKGKILLTKRGLPIIYKIYLKMIVIGAPSAEDKKAILEKLEEWRALTIIAKHDILKYLHGYTIKHPATTLTYKDLDPRKYLMTVESLGEEVVFLEILPEFDNLYRKYEDSFNCEKNNIQNNNLNIKRESLEFIDQIADPEGYKIKQNKIIIEELKKINSQSNENNENKFPHKLSAGTTWENFTIKFLDGENVYIQVKQFKHNASYKEMGFIGKGNNPNPSEAWIFLKVLAKCNGELTIKDSQAKDKYKKQKEILSKSLKDYFSLEYDPFLPYRSSSEKQGNSYKIKLTLIPPPSHGEDKDMEEDDALGIREYLKDNNPQPYER